MSEENRQFPRVVSGTRLYYRALSLGRSEQEYLLGVVENLSHGGLFIATPRPLRRGMFLTLQIYSRCDPPDSPAVRAKAVVRWRRRWRQPRGMGIQFVEIEGLGQRQIAAWIESILDVWMVAA